MNTVLIVMLAAFLIEQVFCFFLGSYPYRFGIVIRKITLPGSNVASWKYAHTKCSNLKLKVREEKKEVYYRYRYQFGIVGPFIFIGQMKFDIPGTLLIRIGPCAFLLLLSVSLFSIIRVIQDGDFHGLLNMLAVAGAVLFFYFHLVRNIKQCEKIIRNGDWHNVP